MADKDDATTTVGFEEDGDLRLRVGEDLGEPQTFVVCPKALARGSPVFKSMLYGCFSESRPSNGDDWVVNLPNDDSDSLEVLLNIVQGRVHLVPEELDLHSLLGVLAVMDKYGASSLRKPWVKSWIRGVRNDTDDPGLLCVAWELGDKSLFTKMVTKFAEESVEEDGQLVYGNFYENEPEEDEDELEENEDESEEGENESLPDFLGRWIPPDVLDQILKLRGRLVEAEMSSYTQMSYATKTFDWCSYKNPSCNMLVYGCLSHGFAEKKLGNPNKKYKGTVKSLRSKLEDMEIIVKDDNKVPHARCKAKTLDARRSGVVLAMTIEAATIKMLAECLVKRQN